ncbi:MAG: aldo/keto reductase [Methylovirgula sp.]
MDDSLGPSEGSGIDEGAKPRKPSARQVRPDDISLPGTGAFDWAPPRMCGISREAGGALSAGNFRLTDLRVTSHPSAAAAGQFEIGGDIKINRLGFGAMRITGKGIWGDPADPKEARATLKLIAELGINFIDTADSYGPFVSESLIREVLYPYQGLTITTKGGLARTGPEIWRPLGRPEYLRQCVMMSLRRLGVDHIDLWQLHRIDPAVSRDEQFAVVAAMRKEGLIRHVGLSDVGVDDIEAAGKYFPVATVQNRYNIVNRASEDVLIYCEKHNIGFIPAAPLAAGALARPSSALLEIAKALNASPGQVALAWALKRSKVVLPIPGTANTRHLVENVAAAELQLSDETFAALDRQGRSVL